MQQLGDVKVQLEFLTCACFHIHKAYGILTTSHSIGRLKHQLQFGQLRLNFAAQQALGRGQLLDSHIRWHIQQQGIQIIDGLRQDTERIPRTPNAQEYFYKKI